VRRYDYPQACQGQRFRKPTAMTLKLKTFQVGSPRRRGEGLRLGTVRLLPRGVRKQDYASHDYFDVWLPLLAPSRPLLRWARSHDIVDSAADWRTFARRYEREVLGNTDARQTLQLVAQLAQRTPLAIGCYCADEQHCHRSLLKRLIEQAAEPTTPSSAPKR
jgi:uncharacterized protein YeaO (DUF488 family)